MKQIKEILLDIKNSSFSYVPLHEDELFDLSCGYVLSLFERINSEYENIILTSIEINNNIPNVDHQLYNKCFSYVETYIDTYSKIVKLTKISIGEKVGRKDGRIIFNNLDNYHPNNELQKIVPKIRNTSQHFEERLQEYGNHVHPFLEMGYIGTKIDWEIRFGKGGYGHKGHRLTNGDEEFKENKLYFKSYYESKSQIVPITILINEIWKDIKEMFYMMEHNIQIKFDNRRSNLPLPPKNISLFQLPSED